MPTSAVSPRLRAMSRSMFAALVFVVVVSCSVLWAHDAHADSTSDLVSLTNSARASHGLAALTASGDLAAVARAQAGYDLGVMDWTVVDASATPADTLQRSKAALDLR